jgi:hypothetical protein
MVFLEYSLKCDLQSAVMIQYPLEKNYVYLTLMSVHPELFVNLGYEIHTTSIPIVTDDDEEDSKDIKLDLIKTFSVIQHEQNFASIEKTFQNSSWFYQESGERYLQSLLDSIDPRSNYQNQMVTCQKALELASKLILSMRKKNVGWRILRFCLLKYKCAKLRLFLQFDDPVVAIQDLQECLEHYQVFYDESHEFLQDLQETL